MEGNYSKLVTVPVALKGVGNYLLWSRLVKTAIGRLGLWNHITDDGPEPVAKGNEEAEGGKVLTEAEVKKKWVQEDLMVLSVLHSSIEVPLLEAYIFCETPKHLWETLQKTFGDVSNLNRVFELKKAITSLMQGGVELTTHIGKFRALWSELDNLRPSTSDQEIIMERREQDQVFGLLMTLDVCYQDVIKHMLRSPSLPTMEEVCSQLQKEEGSLGLFGGKGELPMAHQAEDVQANKAGYKNDGRKYGDRFEGNCDHCKKPGHKKSQCWILHPHLKPSKFNKEREARAHMSTETSSGSASGAGTSSQVNESEGRALSSHHSGGKNLEHEVIRKSDIDALIKALKESGNKLRPNTLGYSFAAHTMSSRTDRLLDILESPLIGKTEHSIANKLLGVLENLKNNNDHPRSHLAKDIHKL